MIVKADVSPEEKTRIKELAAMNGMSISSYIKRQALCWTDTDPTPVMKFIEAQAPVLQRVNELATAAIQNKVIYEEEVLEILAHVTWIEDVTAAAMKEVLRNGNSG